MSGGMGVQSHLNLVDGIKLLVFKKEVNTIPYNIKVSPFKIPRIKVSFLHVMIIYIFKRIL